MGGMCPTRSCVRGGRPLLRLTTSVVGMAAERVVERNVPIVNEFRANEGRVGGPFEGHTMLLLHNPAAAAAPTT